MAGLEVLFAVAKEHITSQNDALVCCLHWNMIASGYRCIGSGEEVSSRNDMALNSVYLIKNYSKRLYHAQAQGPCWWSDIRCLVPFTNLQGRTACHQYHLPLIVKCTTAHAQCI